MLILPVPLNRPSCLACSLDSQTLYIGCRDGRIYAWDWRSDELPLLFQHDRPFPVLKLACGPDGILAAACREEIWLLDTTTGQADHYADVGAGSALVTFGRLGNLFYTAHAAGKIHSLSVEADQPHDGWPGPYDPLALEGHPDLPWLVLGHGTNRRGGATWWRAEPNEIELAGSFQADSPVCSVALSSRGDRAALGTRAGTVHILDLTRTAPAQHPITLTIDQRQPGNWLDLGVFGLAFSRDGRELYTVSSDGDVQHWDIEGQRLIHSLDWGKGRMRALAFSPNGQTAAALTDTDQVIVWDLD